MWVLWSDGRLRVTKRQANKRKRTHIYLSSQRHFLCIHSQQFIPAAIERLVPTAMQPAALAPGAGCVSARQRGAAAARR
jgi:hypothetical protein